MPEGSPSKHRILIATDAPQDVRIVEEALRGFCRLTVVSAEAAVIEKLENERFPDLILLAVRTPEMDGYEACRRITGDSRWAGVPIVLLDTKTEAIDKPKVYEVGAIDYLTYPLEVHEIRARIGTQLEATSRCADVERRNREKEELLQILSHDLSGTLTIVVWALDLLKDDPGRFDKLEKTMRSAATNGFALIDIVQQLRFAEKKPPELGPVNLKLAVENSLSLLENQIREKDISLQVVIDDSAVVLAEETSLVNAVLKNILSNAVKFSEPGSEVRVSVRHEREMIVLSIGDEGVGIPSEHLDRILDVTRSTNRPGTRGEKGAGFGMPLARRFVDAYGGELEIASVPVGDSPDEHGTTVTIRLFPASAAES